MRPRNHAPGVNSSRSVSQRVSWAHDAGPLRTTTATLATGAMITNSRGGGRGDTLRSQYQPRPRAEHGGHEPHASSTCTVGAGVKAAVPAHAVFVLDTPGTPATHRISTQRPLARPLHLQRQSGNDAPVDQDDGLVRGRPDLVGEVISPSSQRYDRVTKLRWYARLGIPEYWLVDGTARTVERLVLREGAYVIADSLADDETFRPESFEGLEIPLSNLWQ